MSGNPVRRFPFGQWVQYLGASVDPPNAYFQAEIPGDETADIVNIQNADPEVFGKVTLFNSVWQDGSIVIEPYQKLAHLQSPSIFSRDLVGATKIEIVSKFKILQYPPLGSNYATIGTIPVNVDPYVMLRFFNELSDPDWLGDFDDDLFLVDAIGGREGVYYIAPGAGFSDKIRASESYFPAHVPCHGKAFSNGVCILGDDLTDGSEVAAVDEMKEYRLDITGKNYNFIQYLQGTINISQVTVRSAITQNMIVDLYGVWIEVTYAAKPSHGSSLLSSAG